MHHMTTAPAWRPSPIPALCALPNNPPLSLRAVYKSAALAKMLRQMAGGDDEDEEDDPAHSSRWENKQTGGYACLRMAVRTCLCCGALPSVHVVCARVRVREAGQMCMCFVGACL